MTQWGPQGTPILGTALPLFGASLGSGPAVGRVNEHLSPEASSGPQGPPWELTWAEVTHSAPLSKTCLWFCPKFLLLGFRP